MPAHIDACDFMRARTYQRSEPSESKSYDTVVGDLLSRTTDGVVRKTYLNVYVKDIDKKARTEKSVITTDDVDRDAEVVLPAGLDFTQYRKNPIVLFMHELRDIVGRCVWIKHAHDAVIAKTQYAETAFAEDIWRLVSDGILIGKSIGMNCATLQRRDITEDDVRARKDWAGAQAIITSAEILEYSCVSIPANPDALMAAEKAGQLRASHKAFEPVLRSIVDARPSKPSKYVSTSVPATAPKFTNIRAPQRARKLSTYERDVWGEYYGRPIPEGLEVPADPAETMETIERFVRGIL